MSISLDPLKDQILEKTRLAPDLKARFKFDLGEDGIFHVDTHETPAEISEEDKDADITLVCTKETLQGVLNGTQDPNFAYMTGKLRIKGSLGLAMKLNSILED